MDLLAIEKQTKFFAIRSRMTDVFVVAAVFHELILFGIFSTITTLKQRTVLDITQ